MTLNNSPGNVGSLKNTNHFDALCNSRLPYLLVGLCVTFWIAVLNFTRGIPTPVIHDEFSFLFGADTFLSGHLTNPPHPLWKHFETFHTLSNPTWMTKYQWPQTLMLASAKLAFGKYIVAVWLCTVGAALATLWAMRAYLPPRYSFVCGLLFAADPVGPFSWSYNMGYIPVGLPMLAGALVLGGVRQLSDGPARHRDAFLLGLGLSLVILCRPFEGTLISFGLLTAFGLRIRKLRRVKELLTARLLVWLALPVLTCGTFQLIYNKAVVGSYTKLPYLVHFNRFEVSPGLILMKPLPPKTYNNDLLTKFYTMNALDFQEKRTPRGFKQHLLNHVAHQLTVPYIDLRFLIVLIFLFALGLFWTFVFGDWWQRAMVMCLVFFDSVLSLSMYFSMHYVAPAIPLFCVVLGMFVASLPTLRSRNRWLWIVTLISLVGVLLILLPYKRNMLTGWLNKASGSSGGGDLPWNYVRANIESQVAESGKKILILVRHESGQSPHQDWVANHSPVDTAPIIWARSLSQEEDAAVVRYYPNREVWRLTVGPIPGEEFPSTQFPRHHRLAWTGPTGETIPWFATRTNAPSQNPP